MLYALINGREILADVPIVAMNANKPGWLWQAPAMQEYNAVTAFIMT